MTSVCKSWVCQASATDLTKGAYCGYRTIGKRDGPRLFDVSFGGVDYPNMEAALAGKHNALNAAAVFGLSLAVGAQEKSIRKALKTFKGVGRRSERIGSISEILFLDDYAHHPTEIEASLGAIRKAVGERRIVAIYQPHRYSRLQYCLGRFGQCFQEADEIIVTDIYTAGEKAVEGVTTEAIVQEIKGPFCCRKVSREELEAVCLQELMPHDVVVTLGAGDITRFGRGLVETLKKSPPKKMTVGIVKGGASYEHDISLKSAEYIEESLAQDIYDLKVMTIGRGGEMPFLDELMKCAVVFPILHGPYGEDGTIQGMFEMLGMPYVGCSHRACSVAMDKAMTKKLAVLNGIRTLPFPTGSYTGLEKIKGEHC